MMKRTSDLSIPIPNAIVATITYCALQETLLSEKPEALLSCHSTTAMDSTPTIMGRATHTRWLDIKDL